MTLEKSARFITWEKHTDNKAINNLDNKLFSNPFTFHNTVYQVHEMQKVYKNNQGQSIKLRRLVIHNHTTNKRSVAVSNDTYEDTYSLAYAMLNRWGKSENGFKHYGDRTKMHYNPVYEIERLSADQSVLNPDYTNLQKQIKKLKKELAKTEQKLGGKEIKLNKDGSIRKSKVRENLQNKRTKLLKEIKDKKIELSQCPERIDISTIKADKQYKVIETQGKNLWDFTGTVFWNARKELIKIFKEYLPNERDLTPVLEAITTARGEIKSNDNTMTITLEPLERFQFRQAQIQLCRKLNSMKARFDNGKLIIFDVKHKNVQK